MGLIRNAARTGSQGMTKKAKLERTKKSERSENDFYPTPEPVALSICRRVFELHPHFDLIIEPSAGSGVFVRAVKQLWACPVHAIELREEERSNLSLAGADEVFIQPFEEWMIGEQAAFCPLYIGNPPFSRAAKHVELILDYAFPGTWIAFLLKMNFFGSHGRVPFWRIGLPQLRYLIPLIPRPSFKTTERASNDTNEYATFIWEVGYTGKPQILPPIIWREERQKRGTKTLQEDALP